MTVVMEVAVVTQVAMAKATQLAIQEELEARRQVVEAAPKEGAKRGRTGGGRSNAEDSIGRRTSRRKQEMP